MQTNTEDASLLARVERLETGMCRLREALLQLLDVVEDMQGIKPTTAEIRKQYKRERHQHESTGN